MSSASIKRRDFLRLGGAATLTSALASVTNLVPYEDFAYASENKKTEAGYTITKRVPQVCARACECDCAYEVVVGVDKVTGVERAITIEGREADPVSRGKYCVKALGFVDSLYDPNRLLVSVKRTNPKRGENEDPGWVVIDTDQAINEIIEKMSQYKKEEMVFCSPGDAWSNRLCQSLGVRRSDQRTECFGTHYYLNSLMITNPPNEYYSSTYTVTHSIWGFDYSTTKYMLWFGFDSLTKSSKAGILNHIVEGKRNGTKIVSFNPVRAPLADSGAYVDEFYPIKPGTDLAVTLAMIKTILDNKAYNKEFLDKYTDASALIDVSSNTHITDANGSWLAWDSDANKAVPIAECKSPTYEGGPYKVTVDGKEVEGYPVLQLLADNVAECTPEWAEGISDVPAADIERVILEFADKAPEVCIPNLKRDAAGPNYANSWRLMHSINTLQALVGCFDHEGGVLFLHDVKIPWVDEVDPIVEPYPPMSEFAADYRTEFPVTENIYRNLDFSAPGHYGMIGHGLYHQGTTKVVAFKGPHRALPALIQPQMTEKALEKMDLVWDHDLYLDDLAYWCDYVLPSSHQFEDSKLDLRQYYPKIPCYVGGKPVQDAPGDCIGWGGICKKIGFALAPKYWTTDGSNDPEKIIKGDTTTAVLKEYNIAKDKDEFFEKHNGIWVDDTPYDNYATLSRIGYQKPQGRVRLFIDEFPAVNHEPLPKWAERWSASEGDYKFSIALTRAPWHMHADANFINNKILNNLSEKNNVNSVWISPNSAKDLGLSEGDEVVLETNPKLMTELPRPVETKVHITDRVVRDDVVMLFHGPGHRSKWLDNGQWGYRDGDLIPQKCPEIELPHDPTGMGWVEDVYVKISKR